MTDSTRDVTRQMLRHTLATLAYRGGQSLRGAPEEFNRVLLDYLKGRGWRSEVSSCD